MTDVDPTTAAVCRASGQDADRLDADDLVASLTELLEAERAGVRIGARLVQMARQPDALVFARTLRDAEARWCRMLTGALRRLGAKPSTRVGDFYQKVMAVQGLEARLALVNRGQTWVVRRLEDLLPKIRDDRLHADLRAMLEPHVANIELTESALKRRAVGRTR